VKAFEAVAIIVAVFFIAGLMVGFLIVMALPALASRRRGDRRGTRRGGDGQGPRQSGWQEPRGWPDPDGADPDGADPDGADPDGEDGDAGGDEDGPDGPPGIPWWRNTR
jgi:hypothetical protein